MAYSYPKLKLNSDGTFGPTKEDHKYKPVGYHNKTAAYRKDKMKWILRQNEQYEVFRIADEKKWFCEKNKVLFSILDNGDEIFGQLDERLAYFIEGSNVNDPWHGYPIFSNEFDISEELLDHWEENDIISPKIRKKIGKGDL